MWGLLRGFAVAARLVPNDRHTLDGRRAVVRGFATFSLLTRLLPLLLPVRGFARGLTDRLLQEHIDRSSDEFPGWFAFGLACELAKAAAGCDDGHPHGVVHLHSSRAGSIAIEDGDWVARGNSCAFCSGASLARL